MANRGADLATRSKAIKESTKIRYRAKRNYENIGTVEVRSDAVQTGLGIYVACKGEQKCADLVSKQGTGATFWTAPWQRPVHARRRKSELTQVLHKTSCERLETYAPDAIVSFYPQNKEITGRQR